MVWRTCNTVPSNTPQNTPDIYSEFNQNSQKMPKGWWKAGENIVKTLGALFSGGILGDLFQLAPNGRPTATTDHLTISEPLVCAEWCPNWVQLELLQGSTFRRVCCHLDAPNATVDVPLMSHCPNLPILPTDAILATWLSYVVICHIYIYTIKKLYIIIYIHVLYLSYETFEYISCDANPNFTVNSRTFLCKRHNFRRFPNFWDEKLQVPWFMMRVWKWAIWLYSPL
jgi:hypothetical protein